MNIDEISFYLESLHSTHNEEPRTFINDVPTEEPYFEAITNYQERWKNENMKKMKIFGGWILMASKLYRKENLSYWFEDWLYRLSKIKRQAIYNYRNLFKLMSAAPELINCKINAAHLVKSHEILLNYCNELETQTPWKHAFSCMCEGKTVFYALENSSGILPEPRSWTSVFST